MRLEEALDHVAALRAEGTFESDRRLAESAGGERAVVEILMLVADPQIRLDHRERIYADLVASRALLIEKRDPRIVDLIFWGEHVASLQAGKRRGRIETFYFARAMEATCRRCGFDLLQAMGKLDELGKAWAARDYAETFRLLSPDVVELEPPGEAPDELGTKS